MYMYCMQIRPARDILRFPPLLLPPRRPVSTHIHVVAGGQIDMDDLLNGSSEEEIGNIDYSHSLPGNDVHTCVNMDIIISIIKQRIV